jgi:hypothetical protein
MENTQRTIYAAYLQTCKELGLPIQIFNYTTLNQALNIQYPYDYPSDINPILQYAVFGNGGNSFTSGTNGQQQPVPIQHLATDANLYNMLPLSLRLPNNDLTPSQMAGYRLRTTLTVNGTEYIAYYGLLLNLSSISVSLNSILTQNGNTVTSSFTPSESNLSPSPQNLTSLSVNTITGDYVNVNSLLPLILSADQVSEFINASNILYGSPTAAIISEIGLCTGYDISVQGTSNGANINYNEAVAVQINAFINTFYAMYYSQNGLNITFNVGATEPLMLLEAASS